MASRIFPGDEKRDTRRFTPQSRDRNPNGPLLLANRAHKGCRTPNGIIWAHTLKDFFFVELISGAPCRDIWSTSMLQKLNDSLPPSQKELIDAGELLFPRVLQPWPLLCVPNDSGELETLCIGGDEGCEFGHDPRFIQHQLCDFTPEQKRMNLKHFLTKSKNPEIIKNDPRFHIPQSVPCNGRLPPKLEEFIPKEYLPDVLLVHDPDGIAEGTHNYPRYCDDQFEADVPIRYIRARPKPTTDGHSNNFAHLYLSADNFCGRGHHSFVYYAPLMLSAPLTARTPTRQVSVLTKISFPESEHRELLSQEGIIYDTFPQWMMQDYCGYNLGNKILNPVPACAIVPKFYGYYVPEDETQRYLSPILLLENCGLPIRTSTLNANNKTRIHAMFLHLHNAGFLQGSVYPRNILIQPGPLTVPPSKRSMASPSFRIIDFGRADYKRDFLRDAIGVTALERHEKWLEDYDDFITTVGAAEAEKEYTITLYDNKDGECEDKRDKETAKSREVRMVMGLEEDKWTRLCKARRYWAKMVREADQEVCETLWR